MQDSFMYNQLPDQKERVRNPIKFSDGRILNLNAVFHFNWRILHFRLIEHNSFNCETIAYVKRMDFFQMKSLEFRESSYLKIHFKVPLKDYYI